MSLRVWIPCNGVTATNCGNFSTTLSSSISGGWTYYNFGSRSKSYLNGTSSFIQGTYPASANMTFSIWALFYPSNRSTGHLFDARSSDGNTGYQPMYITPTSIQVGNTANGFPTFNYNFAQTTWYHIVVTHNTSAVTCYVNGVQIGTSSDGRGYNFGTNIQFNIGCRCSKTSYLGVCVSDIRIYDQCLSAFEVAGLYHSTQSDNRLRYWYALNGDISNRGTENFTPSLLGSPTYTTIGKMGKALSLTTDGQGVQGMDCNNCMSTFSKYTMCAWVHLTGAASNHSTAIISSGDWNYAANQMVFGLYNYSDGYQVLLVPNRNAWSDGISLGTNKVRLNTWYHLAIVYDGSTTKGYMNGVYIGSYNGGGITNSSATVNAYIGRATYYDGFTLKGYINDVRVYSAALNEGEIKDIARGSKLHYQLIRPATKHTLHYDTNIYSEPDGSSWVRIAHHNNPAGGLFASNDSFSTGVYKDANRWYDVEQICAELSSFEFMVKQKTTSDATEVKYRWKQNKSPLTATYADVSPSAVTRITTSGYTDGGNGGLYLINNYTRACITNATNGNWFGAFGAWTNYSGGIPGYPNTAITSGYMDLYVKLGDWIIETDASGMKNAYNNPSQNLVYTYNSPRYGNCIYFNGVSDSVQIPDLSTLVTDGVFTFSVWFKKTEFGGDSWETIFGGPSGFELEGKLSTSTNAYIHPYSWGGGSTSTPNSYSFAYTFNEWHMVTMVRTSSSAKFYLDGQLKVAGTAGSIPSGSYFLGAWRDTNSQNFKGWMSDARIYGTAFTDDEVLALYNGLI